MSRSAAVHPIIAALVEAERFLGRGRTWTPANDTQRRFLGEFFAPGRDEAAALREIERMASWSHEEVNAFLRRHGFSIALEPFGEAEFGIAAVLDLLVQWAVPGTPTTLRGARGGRFYEAAHLKREVLVYTSRSHSQPIARIQTTSGNEVHLTVWEGSADGIDLVSTAKMISGGFADCANYTGVIFPMVSLDQQVDVSWLRGMETVAEDGRPSEVTQALQQNKLRMNERGARAQSAFAGGVLMRSIAVEDPPLEINRPFLVWFERPGLAFPLFVAHVTEEDWKNPGGLD